MLDTLTTAQPTGEPLGLLLALLLAALVALDPEGALALGTRLNLAILTEIANVRLYVLAWRTHSRLARDMAAMGVQLPPFRFVRIQDRQG